VASLGALLGPVWPAPRVFTYKTEVPKALFGPLRGALPGRTLPKPRIFTYETDASRASNMALSKNPRVFRGFGRSATPPPPRP